MPYGSNLEGQLVIGDDNFADWMPPIVDGKRLSMGLVPRDYDQFPQGYYASAPAWSLDDMPIIPMEEWPERIADMTATKSRISDMYDKGNKGQRIPSLDQNGQGFCWSYSTVGCVQAIRAICGMPYVELSPHSVACKIFNFQDRGAWGALSLDFVKENGVVPASLWPQKSMNRSNDTPSNWEAAKAFRVVEGWMDLKPAAYDRELSILQQGTALLSRMPTIDDFNWWGHSVFAMDLVDVYPNRSARDPSRYGKLIQNSWTDRWGTLGRGVLKDSKAWSNGGACPRVVMGS